jgi:hypothetical protein
MQMMLGCILCINVIWVTFSADSGIPTHSRFTLSYIPAGLLSFAHVVESRRICRFFQRYVPTFLPLIGRFCIKCFFLPCTINLLTLLPKNWFMITFSQLGFFFFLGKSGVGEVRLFELRRLLIIDAIIIMWIIYQEIWAISLLLICDVHQIIS